MTQSLRAAPLLDRMPQIVRRTVKDMVGDKLSSLIASGVLRLGDELPGERELAAAFSVSRETVRFLICDREFHVTIYRASANRLLADVVTDLYTHMMAHRRTAMSRPGAIQKSYEDHRLILRALRARDPAAAVAAFGRHIERIHATTRQVLESPGGPAPEEDRPALRTEHA